MEGLIGSLCKKAVSGPTRSHFLCRPASILTDQTYLIRVWCALSHFITLYKESTVGFSSFSRWPFWRCSRGSRHIPFLSTGCTGSQQSAQWAAVRDKNPATEREQGIAVLSLLARISKRRVNFKSLKHRGCEESHSSRLRDKYRIFISVSHQEEHSDMCCVSSTWRERAGGDPSVLCGGSEGLHWWNWMLAAVGHKLAENFSDLFKKIFFKKIWNSVYLIQRGCSVNKCLLNAWLSN